ncbi:thymidine kinase [Candidatus Babeliales bacterium]|nr:thymidine kinase [Candidatus Babeliales bacterium]
MTIKKQSKGTLEVICGSMFSGKSEELIRQLKRSKIAQKETIAFKHSLDNRAAIEYVVSHNDNRIPAFPIQDPQEILQLLTPDIKVIGIDEAQFFSHELIDVVLELVENGKHVIIAGLNLDFRAVPFGPMPTLMALADNVTKLSAVCIVCGDEAYFSQRLVNGKPAKYNDPLIKVGAQESYQARCRDCYSIDKKSVWQSSL